MGKKAYHHVGANAELQMTVEIETLSKPSPKSTLDKSSR